LRWRRILVGLGVKDIVQSVETWGGRYVALTLGGCHLTSWHGKLGGTQCGIALM